MGISIESSTLLSGGYSLSTAFDTTALLALYATGVRETVRLHTDLGSLSNLDELLPRLGFKYSPAVDGFFLRQGIDYLACYVPTYFIFNLSFLLIMHVE